MRRRVKWTKILFDLENEELNREFFSLYSKLRRGKCMSANRCAYYVLKNYYSTTTIAQLCEKLGI